MTPLQRLAQAKQGKTCKKHFSIMRETRVRVGSLEPGN